MSVLVFSTATPLLSNSAGLSQWQGRQRCDVMRGRVARGAAFAKVCSAHSPGRRLRRRRGQRRRP
eukprot:1187598-Prorocentrum_minimum.AAC.5